PCGGGRNRLPEGHGDPAARRLQHARQPVLLERRSEAGLAFAGSGGGAAFRRPAPDERRLPPRTARDGRRPAGRDASPLPAAGAGAGLQLGAARDASPELPRSATATPVVPARGAPVTGGDHSIPEVHRLLAVLAAGRRPAQLGTAYGGGAEAIASTARSLVTVEVDAMRAAPSREKPASFPHVEVLVGDWREELAPRGPFELV